MSNVSLDETLYYQYMINNNSTSTMLNALSGRDSEDNIYGNMAGVLSALQSSPSWGTGSISDVSTLLSGLGNGYGGIGSLGSFSSVLQTYLNQNQIGAAQMVEKLEDVLEKAAETEGDTLSYQTVEEIYQYFAEMTAGKAQGLQSGESSVRTSSPAAAPSVAETLGTNFDFDSFESETDAMIDGALEEMGI